MASDGRQSVVSFLADSGLVASKAGARRLLAQGAVRFNGRRLSGVDPRVCVRDHAVMEVGSRRIGLRVLPEGIRFGPAM